MKLASGELYFVGESELPSGELSPYVKIGIVRESEKRTTAERLREHQTGNPRHLQALNVMATPVVERIETLMHGRLASHRVSGEWFKIGNSLLESAVRLAEHHVAEARALRPILDDVARLNSEESSDPLLLSTDEFHQIGQALHMAKQRVGFCKSIEGSVRDGLLGARENGVSVEGLISVQVKKPIQRFDETRFKEEEPDLYESLLVEVDEWTRRFVPSKSLFQKLTIDDDEELLNISRNVERILGVSILTREDVQELHRQYLHCLEIQSAMDWQVDLHEAMLKRACGSSQGIEGICTWNRTRETSLKLDKERLSSEYPEQFNRFVSTKQSSPAIVLARDCGYGISSIE